MKTIHVYVEGGGDSNRTQSKMREGFDVFCRWLKELATENRAILRFIPGGSRVETQRDFLTALRSNADHVNILLVDSEALVETNSPKEHLRVRDGWDLSAVDDNEIHFMAQAMEAWLIADPDGLERYYGQGFNRNPLSKRQNLEEEPKDSLEPSLKTASRNTSKGEYKKIKHATELLQCLDPGLAQNRCPHCLKFFQHIERQILKTQNQQPGTHA